MSLVRPVPAISIGGTNYDAPDGSGSDSDDEVYDI